MQKTSAIHYVKKRTADAFVPQPKLRLSIRNLGYRKFLMLLSSSCIAVRTFCR